jgi:hypothetical protein
MCLFVLRPCPCGTTGPTPSDRSRVIGAARRLACPLDLMSVCLFSSTGCGVSCVVAFAICFRSLCPSNIPVCYFLCAPVWGICRLVSCAVLCGSCSMYPPLLLNINLVAGRSFALVRLASRPGARFMAALCAYHAGNIQHMPLSGSSCTQHIY